MGRPLHKLSTCPHATPFTWSPSLVARDNIVNKEKYKWCNLTLLWTHLPMFGTLIWPWPMWALTGFQGCTPGASQQYLLRRANRQTPREWFIRAKRALKLVDSTKANIMTYFLIWSICVRSAFTTRIASDGSVPDIADFLAAVKLST